MNWKRKLSLFLLLALIGGCGATRQAARNLGMDLTDSGKLVNYSFDENRISLTYENLSAVVEVDDAGTVHITAAFTNTVESRYSYAVVNPITPSLTQWESLENPNQKVISVLNPETQIGIGKNRFTVALTNDGKQTTAYTFYWDLTDEEIIVVSPYQSERFFGLGEKTGDLELTGRDFTMWNTDHYRYTKTTDPIYASIPFYLAVNDGASYGVFYDNPSRAAFSFTEEYYGYGVNDYQTELYFIPEKDSVSSVIETYTDITGKPYFPPLYGFGFHQCRYSYTNQAQALSVADQFAANDLPLDVIYLDIGFMSNNMAFTYGPENYPDPVEMNETLAEMNIRTVAIVDPGIKRDTNYSVYTEGLEQEVYCLYNDKPYSGTVWPGMCNFPDFTKESTYAWWEDQQQTLIDLGITGYWNDMNEPSVFSGTKGTMPNAVMQDNFGNPRRHEYLHNVYGLTMIQATHQALSNIQQQRPFILTRAAYSGAQRYAFVWTGDNTANWDHLRMNVSMALNLGLSGIPFCGADIGGYSDSPTPELFTRWIQLAAFMPFMRDHSESGTEMQEPYVFTEYLDIIREYMNLRYELMPYLYTQAFLASQTGIPIVRPLFLEYGYEYLDTDKEFLFGEDILVCPVLDEGALEITVIIPEGVWYEFHTGEMFTEGEYTLPVTMENIPVFVRESSIIPTYQTDYSGTMEIDESTPVTLLIYPDMDGYARGTLYEDDGLSYDYTDGEFRYTDITLKSDEVENSLFIDTSLEIDGTCGSYKKNVDESWDYLILGSSDISDLKIIQ